MNRAPTLLAIVMIATSLAAVEPARSAVMTTTGDVFEVAPPGSVSVGDTESDTDVLLFAEPQGVTLSGALSVDVLDPGTYGPNADLNNFPQGTLAAGTIVDSFFLHADQVGTAGVTSFSGSVTFERDIAGIQFDEDSIDSTNALFGASSTSYTNTNRFGIQSDDTFTLSADRRTLTFGSSVGGGADQLRIFTVVPSPSTGVVGLALFGLALSARGPKPKR